MLDEGFLDRFAVLDTLPARRQLPFVLKTPQAKPGLIALGIRSYSLLGSCGTGGGGAGSISACCIPQKTKRRVSFADERGLQLTQVKWMPGSDDRKADGRQQQQQYHHHASPRLWKWTGAFRTLAPDPTRVVQLTEVRMSDDALTGCVQVHNLSYEKSVCVRCTFDGWRSYEDTYCEYAFPAQLNGSDLFRFSVLIPRNRVVQRVEFCLRFCCDRQEFWDNNGNKNYVIERSDERQSKQQRTPSGMLEECNHYW